MSLYRDQGVVLRTIRLGEADRIVTLATAGRGKVRAVVKGVRRTRSRWGARLEPLSHVSVLCWQGRELDIVTQAEVLDHFRATREDLDRLRRATSLLEAVDQVSQEGHADPRLYVMLVGALRALDARDSPLLVPAFFWKLLALEGSAPLLDSCARCGAAGEAAGEGAGETAGEDAGEDAGRGGGQAGPR
ncbi:MAG: DNA repair protein RecO, partial [Acidimicrobiales bacterium]